MDGKPPKIALLKLKENVDFNKDSDIRPICIDQPAKPEAAPRVDPSLNEMKKLAQEITIEITKKQLKNAARRMSKKAKEFSNDGKKHKSGFKKSSVLQETISKNKYSECYVSGWGTQTLPSIAYLAKEILKKEDEVKESIAHQPKQSIFPIQAQLPSGQYVIIRDMNEEKPKLPNRKYRNVPDSDEIAETNENIAEPATFYPIKFENSFVVPSNGIVKNKFQGLNFLPNLDPVEDYENLASTETWSTPKENLDPWTTTPSIFDLAKKNYDAQSSGTRKKQLNPEHYYPGKPNSIPKFVPIESDELLVDKIDAAELANRRGATKPKYLTPTKTQHHSNPDIKKYQLKQAPVNLLKFQTTENVDLSLGTHYIENTKTKDSSSLCMVDLGSPVVCKIQQSKDAPSTSFLAGVVTWKLPCIGLYDFSHDDLDPEINYLGYNYTFVQVTPVEEFVDFVLERSNLQDVENETKKSML